MLEPNEHTQAQQKALDTLSFIELIENLISNLKAFFQMLPKELRIEAQTHLGSLEAIYEAINDDSFDIGMLGMTNSLSKMYPSKIQRMGIASQLVAMREEGKYTIAELSERFGISTSTVSSFFQAYDVAKPAQKARMSKNSVYDIQDNMENLHAMLLRTISRFELDGDINNKNLSEYRQLITLAHKQLKDITAAEKFDRLAILIEEVLLQHCLPESRQHIMLEFQRLGLSGYLEPMSAKPSTPRLKVAQ
jgi:transcriptional regulator with XRE-family HTH domain